jgi:regulator of protease activity HflC (stomatin/prohibitin superfamily)
MLSEAFIEEVFEHCDEVFYILLPILKYLISFPTALIEILFTIPGELLGEMAFLFTFFIQFLFTLFILGVIVYNCSIIVEQGNEVIVERLGRYSRTLGPGAYLLVPFIDRCKTVTWNRTVEENIPSTQTKRIIEQAVTLTQFPRNKELIFDPPQMEVITKDKIPIMINVVVFYKITDIIKAVYDVEDVYKAIQQLITVGIRSICSVDTFDRLMETKDYINSGILENMIDHNTEKRWGIKIMATEIQNISASKAITNSTENLLVARRQAEITLLNQSAARDSKILEAKTYEDVENLKVKSEIERATLRYESEQKRKMGETNLEIQMIGGLLKAGIDKEYLNSKIYADALKTAFSKGSNKLILPYDACKFMGPLSISAASFGTTSDIIDK